MKRRELLKTAAVAALFAGAGIAPAHAEDPIKVRIAYDAFTMTVAPMQYAQAKGLFAKHGLDAELLFVEGGSVLTQSLVGGSVDIAQNGYAPVVNAAVAGADVVIIGGIANVLPMMLVVDGKIASAEDLKGQAIAISRYGSATDVAARMALEHLGLTANDVNILQLGNEGTRLAAYKSGQVKGLMTQLPGAQDLVDQGARVLVDVGAIAKGYPNTAFATTRKYLKNNPEAVKRFYMAMGEALHQFGKDPEGALAVTAEFLKIDPGGNLPMAVDYFSKNVYQKDLRPSVAGVGTVLTELAQTVPAAAGKTPESMVDSSVLDALTAEGYFTNLS